MLHCLLDSTVKTLILAGLATQCEWNALWLSLEQQRAGQRSEPTREREKSCARRRTGDNWTGALRPTGWLASLVGQCALLTSRDGVNLAATLWPRAEAPLEASSNMMAGRDQRRVDCASANCA